MLVRYRLLSGATHSDFITDMNNIITGNVTNVANLSASCDKTNSSIYGSYPAGAFTRVNGTTYTYSKMHNTNNTYTHYFRLNFDANGNGGAGTLANITLAQGYTSGTDTLLNSTTYTTNIRRFTYDSNYPVGIDIIVNTKMFVMIAPQSGYLGGIFDIGHNGVTRTYTSSMLMCHQDMTNVVNFGANTGATIPYTYNFDTLSYSSLTFSHGLQVPLKKYTASAQLAVLENPTFITTTQNGSVYNVVYGLYKLPTNTFAGIQTYKDAANLYRLSVNDYALLVD